MDRELESIYLNAELSCRHITNVRLALPKKHPKTNGKSWVLDWPRTQKRFLSPKEFDSLLNRKMVLLNYRSGVDFYLISKEIYDQIKQSCFRINHQKFNVFRDYFAIQRLRYISENYLSEVTCTIEYRPSKTQIPDWPLTTINRDLIAFLKTKEDVNGKFEVKRLNLKSKIRSHLFPLVFQKLNLFKDKKFDIEHRESKVQSIKGRGYILLKEKEKFLEIAQTTEENMLKITEDENLFQDIKLIVEEFERRKIGA